MTETVKSATPVEPATKEKRALIEQPGTGPGSVTVKVWSPGKTASREDLFKQALASTRDAVPVMSYDVSYQPKGATPQEVDGVAGTAWEIEVTYTPRDGAPKEPVDLEKVIKEAQAGYGDTHPGDPNFGNDDDAA